MDDRENNIPNRDGFDQRLLRHKVLTRAQEHDLAVRMKDGDKQAADQLLLCNLKLIAVCASRYTAPARHLSFADLMMVGIAVFIDKLPLFDPAKGNRISTYMSWWIHHAMKRALDNEDRLVRFPVHVLTKVRRLDRPPANGPYRPDRHRRARRDRRSLDEYDLRLLQAMIHSREVSLDAPLNEDTDGFNLAGLLNAADLVERILTVPPPDAGISHDLMAGRLAEQVAELPQQQRAVLECRFWKGMTLKQTADYLFERNVIVNQGFKKGQPVCRERIRQIQEKALATLRRRLPDLE